MTLRQLMHRFSTEDACTTFLRDLRWRNGVRCPRCKGEKVYALKTRPFHWVCKSTNCGGRNGYRFHKEHSEAPTTAFLILFGAQIGLAIENVAT